MIRMLALLEMGEQVKGVSRRAGNNCFMHPILIIPAFKTNEVRLKKSLRGRHTQYG